MSFTMNNPDTQLEPLMISGKICLADVLISIQENTWIGSDGESQKQLEEILRIMRKDEAFKQLVQSGKIRIPELEEGKMGFYYRDLWEKDAFETLGEDQLSYLEAWKSRQLESFDLSSPLQLSMFVQWFIQQEVIPKVESFAMMTCSELQDLWSPTEDNAPYQQELQATIKKAHQALKSMAYCYSSAISELFPISNLKIAQCREEVSHKLKALQEQCELPEGLFRVLCGELCPIETGKNSLLGMIYEHTSNTIAHRKASVQGVIKKLAK